MTWYMWYIQIHVLSCMIMYICRICGICFCENVGDHGISMDIRGQLCHLKKPCANFQTDSDEVSFPMDTTAARVWGSNGSKLPVLLKRGSPGKWTHQGCFFLISGWHYRWGPRSKSSRHGSKWMVSSCFASLKFMFYHPKHPPLVGREESPVYPVAPWFFVTHSQSSTSSPARKTRSRSIELGSCHMLIEASNFQSVAVRFARKSLQKLPVVFCFMVNMMINHGILREYPNVDGVNQGTNPSKPATSCAGSPNGRVLVILQPSLCRPSTGLNPIFETSPLA